MVGMCLLTYHLSFSDITYRILCYKFGHTKMVNTIAASVRTKNVTHQIQIKDTLWVYQRLAL